MSRNQILEEKSPQELQVILNGAATELAIEEIIPVVNITAVEEAQELKNKEATADAIKNIQPIVNITAVEIKQAAENQKATDAAIDKIEPVVNTISVEKAQAVENQKATEDEIYHIKPVVNQTHVEEIKRYADEKVTDKEIASQILNSTSFDNLILNAFLSDSDRVKHTVKCAEQAVKLIEGINSLPKSGGKYDQTYFKAVDTSSITIDCRKQVAEYIGLKFMNHEHDGFSITCEDLGERGYPNTEGLALHAKCVLNGEINEINAEV